MLEQLGIRDRVLQNSWETKTIGRRNMKGSLMPLSYFIDEEDNKHSIFYVASSYLINAQSIRGTLRCIMEKGKRDTST